MPEKERSTAGFKHGSASGVRDNHTRGTAADFLLEKIKPGAHLSVVSSYFTIYAYVRFGFANPKQILDIYRILCSGKGEVCTQLCNLFDQQTNHGRDMKDYDRLLQKKEPDYAC